MPTRQELLAAALDPEFQKELGSSFRDTMLRGLIAQNAGLPVDMYQDTKALFGGQANPNAVGGSEWIGNKMQQAGLIGGYRNPNTEMAASLVAPMALGHVAGKGYALARGLFK